MDVSRQSTTDEGGGRGPRARTRRLMLETATRLMQEGAIPSVSEVAEAAEVSRATAYRYFPSQAALVEAVVDEALGPILAWRSTSSDAVARVADLFHTSLPRVDAFEATFKAALKLSLDQWALRRAGVPHGEPQFRRGHRIVLLREALRPLESTLPAAEIERLAQALSLIFGVEALVVLKDIWGLDGERAESVATWAAVALVRAALGHDQDSHLARPD
jgi:AcrR family transcriptional regulator